MATRKNTGAVPASVQRQLRSLAHRVSWLERALKPGKSKTPVDRARVELDRERAERDARNKAMREYEEQERIAMFRQYPRALEIAQEMERKRNAFLRERGLKSEPSMIPEALRNRGD